MGQSDNTIGLIVICSSIKKSQLPVELSYISSVRLSYIKSVRLSYFSGVGDVDNLDCVNV